MDGVYTSIFFALQNLVQERYQMREIIHFILFAVTTTTNVEFSSIVQPCLLSVMYWFVGPKFCRNCFYKEKGLCGGPNLNFQFLLKHLLLLLYMVPTDRWNYANMINKAHCCCMKLTCLHNIYLCGSTAEIMQNQTENRALLPVA